MKYLIFGILFILMFTPILNAEIYQTPGAVIEYNSIAPETTTIPEDTLDNDFPFWIIFIIIVTISAAYIQIKYFLKKKRNKKKGLVPNFVDDALKNMDKAKELSKTPKEFDNLIEELGLEDVKDEIVGLEK